jgi:hypothetical protein
MGLQAIEEFLVQSFGEGIFSRELRLSKEEAGFVQKKYPMAKLKKHTATEAPDGKCWYEIQLKSPAQVIQTDLQQENLRLKRELERIKTVGIK